VKDVELKLIAELMRNSRRSDRELARAVGVSQPTVSRAIAKLKKDGVIREFTVIPDYEKLGYGLVAFTLVKMKADITRQELEEARKVSLRDMKQAPTEIVLFERGLGDGYVGMLVSFHEDYSDYSELKERMRHYPFLDTSATLSFILDLKDKIHYRYLTFSTLASDLLERAKEKKSAPNRRSL
jgi:DNA-binding Lrp family transcriptional regulator